MVHRDLHGGTLVLDRHFRGVGRLKRATGTEEPAVFRRLNAMVTELHGAGRLDLLRAIRDGKLTLLEVYDAYRRKALDQLPTGDTADRLDRAMTKWIEGLSDVDASVHHRESLQTSRRYFLRAKKDALVADLPSVLDTLRTTLGKTHRRSFNVARSAALAFVRDTLKKSHPLYAAVVAVEPVKVPRRRVRAGLTRAEMLTLFPRELMATDPVVATAWAMAVTGMGPKEYAGSWHVKPDRIHIAGTKRAGRVRDVPLIERPARPQMHARTFADKLTERTTGRVTPYVLRRTYAHWMEEAGVPRTRRKLYLGHGTADVTSLYEVHEVETYLASDGEKLRKYLGIEAESAALRLVTEEGA